ncbi:SPOR domain-containing protein [Celerinatantimonas sp. YJH-8]|uniref:SPOR domain-containing protein n=1 Tax=Celerinatantimonas sp. YJH-8 TaxID=3228714 RepID=UPI0038C7B368
MARDYVGRKPSPNKKGRKPTPPPSRRLPILAVIILVVAIAAFVGVLWHIKNSAKAPAPLPAAVVPKAPAPVQVKPLPKQPKEPDYIRELENKQVKVKVPKREKSEHRYQMQCAAFRNRSDAETMKAKIAFSGLSSQVRRSEGKKGAWFKVVLGPYDTRRKAESDRHLLERNNINTCQIWYWTWD